MATLARRLRASANDKRQPLPGPTAIERIARHPFFLGLALLMAAHVLMAPTVPMTVFFGGFVLLGLVGIPMQDHKLRRRHGAVYEEFTDATSVVPFGAPDSTHTVSAGKMWRAIAIGIVGAVMVGVLHPLWKLNHGAWFAIAVALGGSIATAKQVLSSRR